MKVKRKNCYMILEDCFDAEERGAHVRITRHRSTVIVDAKTDDGKTVEFECNLNELTSILVAGGKKYKTRVFGA